MQTDTYRKVRNNLKETRRYDLALVSTYETSLRKYWCDDVHRP